jgi:Mg-chelatase subunit ChlI
MRDDFGGDKGMNNLSRTGGRAEYPFTAIVGQDEMKKALILNVINPAIGGALVFGEKGTAKSTAVRSLTNLLPKIEAVKGCRFRCEPPDAAENGDGTDSLCPECLEKLKTNGKLESDFFHMRVVDLPVSATEDRVVGALDIESAIALGKKKFETGVLAAANRGILYVDEVNLLDDHIVDLLLDSAAMGVNTVEREGISFSHPARFILVGTMNPEEGELRPQLLDRFGLCVEITGIRDADQRVEIIKRRGAYEEDPAGFAERFQDAERELAGRIVSAQKRLKYVTAPDALLRAIVLIAIDLEIDGHRGEITLMKAAKANAAFEGRTELCAEDIRAVAKMVFMHRLKSLPFENARSMDMERAFALLDGEQTA